MNVPLLITPPLKYKNQCFHKKFNQAISKYPQSRSFKSKTTFAESSISAISNMNIKFALTPHHLRRNIDYPHAGAERRKTCSKRVTINLWMDGCESKWRNELTNHLLFWWCIWKVLYAQIQLTITMGMEVMIQCRSCRGTKNFSGAELWIQLENKIETVG